MNVVVNLLFCKIYNSYIGLAATTSILRGKSKCWCHASTAKYVRVSLLRDFISFAWLSIIFRLNFEWFITLFFHAMCLI